MFMYNKGFTNARQSTSLEYRMISPFSLYFSFSQRVGKWEKTTSQVKVEDFVVQNNKA